MQLIDDKKFRTFFFRYVMGACAVAMFVAVGMYAYLGSFSRYLSDDYCETVRVTETSPLNAVLDRYLSGDWRAANRYSNLLFVGFSEWLGPHSMQITTASMILLWTVGLSWSVHETRRFLKVDWTDQVDWFLGASLAFLIILQAPNRFQTLYWRSSMMTHFAPLVFGLFLFAFWVRQAGRTVSRPPSLPIHVFICIATFIIAGFSEPPVTTMVTALPLIMLAVWFRVQPPARNRFLILLAWTFMGAFIGLLAMVFSPTNAKMVQDSTPGVFEILRDSFLFSYIFILFSIKQFPLPAIISILIPASLVWLYNQGKISEPSQRQMQFIRGFLFTAPFIMWLLIAAGFSPSVYGQGFPVERMRFLARSIMTATLMLEGAFTGLLLGKLHFKPNPLLGRIAVVSLFSIIGFVYPLRASLKVYRELPEYRTRAQLWDLRNAYIIRHAAMGQMDIIVPGYSGVYYIKELDDDPNHWVNLCAAKFYGVNSIRAVSIPDEFIMEYLNE